MMTKQALCHVRWLVPVIPLAASVAHAEEGNGRSAMEPDATEETLALPDEAAPQARESAEYGLREANEARDARRD